MNYKLSDLIHFYPSPPGTRLLKLPGVQVPLVERRFSKGLPRLASFFAPLADPNNAADAIVDSEPTSRPRKIIRQRVLAHKGSLFPKKRFSGRRETESPAA